MKLLFLSLALLGTAVTSAPDPPAKGTLLLTVENITEARGELEIVVYDSAETYQRSGRVVRLPVSREGTLEVPLEAIPFGEVAILIYHDVDGNQRFNQNRLGIPQEPYGFSNNVRPMFRGPGFEEAKFTFGTEGQGTRIKIGGIWD